MAAPQPRDPRDATTSKVDPPAPSSIATRRVDPPSRPSEVRRDRFGRYPVVGVLGVGGMGEVLEVDDAALARTVALKVIKGEADTRQVDKFLLEARVTGQLEHPGIPPVYELGTTPDGQTYFTMKRVCGADLARLIERDRADGNVRPLAEWLAIFLKVCESVAFAHSRGVIHRDLKPANVMVGAFGEVLVMDWGLARVAGAAEVTSASHLSGVSTTGDATQDGAILGTPGYMPPEQARGEVHRLDERADIYALGAILYEILAGVPAFAGSSPLAVLAQVVDEPLPPPSARAGGREVPWELEAVVLRAMAREPEDRYPDALALKADVAAFLEGRRVRAARYGLVAAARNWARRHRVVLRMVGAVLATALLFGAALAVQEVRARRAHRDAIRWERRLIDEAKPDVIRSQASDLVARAHPDAALRLPPTPTDKELYTAHLARLRALAVRYVALIELDREDQAAHRALHDTLIAVGRLATVAEEQVLAEHALTQAAGLGVDRAFALVELEKCRAARDARAARQHARVLAVLERVRSGAIRTAGALDAARVELASYRDRATVEVLVRELDQITARLVAATRSALLSTVDPTTAEREAGWTALSELEPALDRWFASEAPSTEAGPAPALDAATLATVSRAFERLALRERAQRGGGGAPVRKVSELLAHAQTRALAQGGADLAAVLRLVCECLGYLGDGDLPPAALARYCWAEWDELRAVPAGLALARLRPAARSAQALLDELVGIRPRPDGRTRWTVNGPWWIQVSALIQDLQASGLATEVASVAEAGASGTQWAEEGLACYGRGEYERAIAAFDRALGLDPGNVSARINRGNAHRMRGALERAILDYTRVIELAPREVHGYYNRGTTHLDRRELAAAIADFDSALELDPRFTKAWAFRGVARARRGDRDGAFADFAAALALDTSCVPALVGRAYARLHQGDLDAALADSERALAVDPREVGGYITRAMVRAMRGEHALAGADGDRAVELGPDNPEAYSARGYGRYAKKDLVGAAADHTRAIELEPERADHYFNRGIARGDQGDLDGAVGDYARALELDPRYAVAHVNRGLIRAQRRDYAAAIADYTRAIELEPSLAIAWGNRAVARYRAGEPGLAREDFDRALALAPDEPRILTDRGSFREDQGEHAEAIADFDRAIALDPGLARAWTGRGQAKLAQGDVDGAQTDHDRAIALDESDPGAHTSRSLARKAKGDVAGALADLERAIALDPRFALAFVNRGNLLLDRGEVARARVDFDRAIELEPARATAWNSRGLARKLSGDLAGAVADFDHAIALDPRLASAYSNRGNVRRAQGELAAALADLDRAVELEPEVDNHYNNRGLARQAAGDVEGALSDYDRSLALDPRSTKALFNRGSVHLARGNLAGALSDFDRAIELGMRDGRLFTNRGNIRQRRGELGPALEDYARAIEIAPGMWQPWCMRGRALGLLGRRDEALAALARAKELAPADAQAGIDAHVREVEGR